MENKAISPEWLEAHGFALVIPGKENEWNHRTECINPSFSYLNPFPANFDITINEGDLCYLEKELDRKQFCIVLTPNEYTDHSKYFNFEIYIQEDIGCGFINIPNQFCEMTEYHFCLLYEAIRREKL